MMTFLHKPQQVWLRKAMFQIHLWVGVILALYFVVIGVSGSILVFRHEISNWMSEDRPPLQIAHAGEKMSPGSVLRALEERYPGKKIFSLRTPHERYPAYTATVQNISFMSVSVDPYTGEILREDTFKDTWLNFTARLHINLNSGRSGFIANGIGGIFLFLLCITGIVIWWPGIRTWKRALQVDFRKGWKRVNFDLHSAAGFWMMIWLMMWSVTTIYFVWPTEFKKVIELASPITKAETIHVPPRGDAPSLPLDDLLAKVQSLYPEGHFTGISFPFSEKQAMVFQMSRTRVGDFSEMDFVHMDPSTGEHLGTPSRREPRTLGDWIVWIMIPIHFGDAWGMTVKIIWAVAGVSLPLLTVTGLLMYWNRYLRRKWKQLREPATLTLDLQWEHDKAKTT